MINDYIMDYLEQIMNTDLIDNIELDDEARAGVVIQGQLQGDPMDPDEARISVEIYENDPDAYNSGASGMTDEWSDKVIECEIGGCATWARSFTIKARVLLVDSGEAHIDARKIARTVRSRIERSLLTNEWNIVDNDDGEYVSLPPQNNTMKGETRQSGGPPDAYDFHIKIRFQVWTTTGV